MSDKAHKKDLHSSDITKMASPVLDLSGRTPIEIDPDTKALLLKNRASDNEHLFIAKAAAWQPLAVCIALALIFFIVRTVTKSSGQPQPKALPLPEVVALAQAEKLLTEIKAQSKIDPHHVEEYVLQLSNTIRFYFERKFNIAASHQTSQEFIESLISNSEIDPDQKKRVLYFIEIIDKIKFARYYPSLKECLDAHEEVLQIINYTLE